MEDYETNHLLNCYFIAKISTKGAHIARHAELEYKKDSALAEVCHPAPEHSAVLAVCAAVGSRTKQQFNEILMGRFRAKQRTADWSNNCNCDTLHSFTGRADVY
jgi:hypothetical protein